MAHVTKQKNTSGRNLADWWDGFSTLNVVDRVGN